MMAGRETNEVRAESPWIGAFDLIPAAAAVFCFVVGAAALIAAVTPEMPNLPGVHFAERLVHELPELAQSISGIVLIALAYGLSRRLNAAMVIAIALLAHAVLYSALRTQDYPAAALYVVGAAILFAARHAFYRRAALFSFVPNARWAGAVMGVLAAAAISAVLWAADRPGFAAAPWWALFTDPHLGRAGRALAAAATALICLGVWAALLRPARPRLLTPGADDLTRAQAIMAHAQAPRPDQNLALLADKAFLFSPNDEAFIMYARAGGSLIAMGAPVGARAAWRPALAAFRAAADAQDLRPVIYAAPPELLPELLDLGFKIEKLGENAIVDLDRFSLVGKAMQNLRTARRKLAEREEATFEVDWPPHDEARLGALAAVSDAWLAHQKGREKGFSLGRFDRAYFATQPIAVVRQRGRVIAFANLMTTPDRSSVAIDLMRHDPGYSPSGTMDFLFVELFAWAKAEGYRRFDLGMAPLSGLAEERFAPLFARFGRFVFERGDALYGFEGLRKFKEKFGPDWEPRYLAAPGAWSLPLVLAEAGMLTAAGPKAKSNQ
jgi:lysylphosphatidylglycerol synthetase-like protein (DUF2156 family)